MKAIKGKKPNVLFFFTDDQRFDTIHALGNTEIITPNMDRLVGEGTSFTHACIPCGTSGAVCMPSRAMLNSGRTLFHIDHSGEIIPKAHKTLGQALRENGYSTFGTGKWHNGRESFHRSFSDGNEIFFGGMADHWNVPVYNFDPTGKYDTKSAYVKEWFTSNETAMRDCDHIHAGKHSTDLVCESALEFISRHDDSNPFFAYISFLAPHDPRTMPDKFRKMYDPEKISLPKNFMGGHPFDTGALRIRDELLAEFPRSPSEIRRHIAEYYSMISHLDYQLGRIFEMLEKKKIIDNTIIVLCGDNGLALGQHGLMGKQSCYDHSVRVPLIFAGPGIPKNRRTSAFAYLFDIFPTLCELTGVDTPSTVEGKSLLKSMCRKEEKIRDSLYFAYSNCQRAVRNSRFKLIEYVIGGRHIMTQLFDIVNDPLELENLAEKSECRKTLLKMRAEMKRLRDEWDDKDSEWGKVFWKHCHI